MLDEHTPMPQDIAAGDWRSRDAGKHYRELARWLRGIPAKCRLPGTQRELLSLARRYDARAEHEPPRCCIVIGEIGRYDAHLGGDADQLDADSPLEGSGFEPSVPPRTRRTSREAPRQT